jgi:hypothetical protein
MGTYDSQTRVEGFFGEALKMSAVTQTRKQQTKTLNSVEKQGTVPASIPPRPQGMTSALGEDPAMIDRLVQQAAYFSLFSIPNPASPSAGIPLIPSIPVVAIGFLVREGLHRFEVRESGPMSVCGFRINQAISSDQVAQVSMQMTPMPNNFQAGEGRVPPPTVLVPFLSQRFTPLNGGFNFLDSKKSGFGAVGAGRTFPALVAGALQTRLAAVLDINQPTGQLAGLVGTGIVIGDIEPPGGFHFNVMFRIIDPDGSLQSTEPVPPLQSPTDPEPGTVFMPFLSEPDPDHPLTAQSSSDGKYLCVRIVERLRLVDLSFDVGSPGLRSRTTSGPIVGRHSMTLILDQSLQTEVIPGYSQDDEFSFCDKDGLPTGGFKANLFEARVFPTRLLGLQSPIYRIGGFALPTQGTGQFKNPTGLVSINGAYSLATGAVSILYMVRFSDPHGVFTAPAS